MMEIRPASAGAAAVWYCIRLNRDEYEGGELGVIQGAFQQIYFASKGPEGMAMLGESDGEGGYRIWFTPRAAPRVQALVKTYAAVADEPLGWRRMEVLFGNPEGANWVTREF